MGTPSWEPDEITTDRARALQERGQNLLARLNRAQLEADSQEPGRLSRFLEFQELTLEYAWWEAEVSEMGRDLMVSRFRQQLDAFEED